MKVAVLTAVWLAAVSAEWNAKQCPPVSVVKPFDYSQINGVWYQYSGIGSIFPGGAGKCAKAYYWYWPDPVSTGVLYTQANPEGKFESVNGIGIPMNASDPDQGTLTIKAVTAAGNKTFPLWVLGLNYEHFGILWSCVPLGPDKDVHRVSIILTRQREPDMAVLQPMLDEEFAKIEAVGGPKLSDYTKLNQKDCDTCSF